MMTKMKKSEVIKEERSGLNERPNESMQGDDMKKKSEIKLKRTMDAGSVHKIITDLAKNLKDGTLVIETGEEFVTLKTGSQIEFELNASQKKNKQKLVIDLSWRLPSLKADEEDSFKISNEEPEITDPSPVEEEEDEE